MVSLETLEKMKEETRETIKRSCCARMGELLAEIYKDYNANKDFHPYSKVISYMKCLGVELPNMKWSDTTFTLPLSEFCDRMFNQGTVDIHALGMCSAFMIQMKEYKMVDPLDDVLCKVVALNIKRKCDICW